jgi:hypothetical protein
MHDFLFVDEPGSIISIAFGALDVCDKKTAEMVTTNPTLNGRFMNFVNSADHDVRPHPRYVLGGNTVAAMTAYGATVLHLIHDLGGTAESALTAQAPRVPPLLCDFGGKVVAVAMAYGAQLLNHVDEKPTRTKESSHTADEAPGRAAFEYRVHCGESAKKIFVNPLTSTAVQETNPARFYPIREYAFLHEDHRLEVNGKLIDSQSSSFSSRPDPRPQSANLLVSQPNPEVSEMHGFFI